MKSSTSRKVFNIFNIIIMIILIICALYPFINQIAVSLSSSDAILFKKITFLPKEFTIKTYKDILKESQFWTDYKNTLLYTFLGTLLGMIFTTTSAYAFSKKRLVGGKYILYFFMFTMFFGGGIIPTYVVFRNLGLINNMFAVILPNMILPYHILLMKAYFEGLPPDLEDAASIDGLSQFGYFVRIVLPLSKPIIATMILFIAVLYWNDWFSASIFLNDPDKQPLTIYLKGILNSATPKSGNVDASQTVTLSQSVQAASTIIAILPIMIVYPLVQKHFTKGIMLGAVKG